MMPFAQTQMVRKLEVTHVLVDSTKPFANVQAFLEAVIPSMDLAIDSKREWNANVVQYEFTNTLTTSTIPRCTAGAALYVPLRVILYESGTGGSRFEYDLPSTLLGQFESECIGEAALRLDDALQRILATAGA